MKRHDREMVKATTMAEWKRIEARLLRSLAEQCRHPDLQHWKPTDIADQMDLEAERREHPEKFAPELRLPMYHPDDVAGVTEPVRALRPTYDELARAVQAARTEGEGLSPYDGCIDLTTIDELAARLDVTT